jgi:general secretion pathway protein G
MVVIVIIGLLGTITVMAIIPQVDTAAIESSRASMHIVRGAIRDYRITTGHYPESLADLTANPGLRGWRKGGYLMVPPESVDAWGRRFHYESPRRGTDDFVLLSLGRDGDLGGTDMDADFGPDDVAESLRK